MKKNANRKHARLQSLDSAQLAQVAGGVNTEEYYGMLNDWLDQIEPNAGETPWNAFWSGAIRGAVSPP